MSDITNTFVEGLSDYQREFYKVRWTQKIDYLNELLNANYVVTTPETLNNIKIEKSVYQNALKKLLDYEK